jgi:hypothetical protein
VIAAGHHGIRAFFEQMLPSITETSDIWNVSSQHQRAFPNVHRLGC